jgi:hypothetical protein
MVLELEASQTQIQRILQSKTFRTSEVQRNLLTYLAGKSLSGTADGLKEYTVGLDVFAKPASYDPRQESVVRMHVARLRQKLTEYYRTEGADDPILVDLPKGAFKITFQPRSVPAVEPERPLPASRRNEMLLAALLAVAIASALYFGVRFWRLERASTERLASEANASWTPELQQLWEPILGSTRPVMVCLATPLLVRFPGNGFVREPSLNDWSDVGKSKAVASLQKSLHAPTVVPFYGFTGVGTASGAFLLGQFLASRRQNVLLTRSDMLSMPEVTMDNVIFLGPVSANRQIQALATGQPIVLEPEGIRNLNPLPGQPDFISDHPPQGVPDNEESHALISHGPGIYGHGEILYLSGNQISSVMAAVQAFTDPNVARSLVGRLKNADGKLPRYYQVVLKVRSMDNMPIEISYMFHRELAASKQSASTAP